ncbi:hypothetical protein EAKF1_ch3931c [Escherichia albertii KF1]|nr:hypothetical protein EAKF1_ch3931c [Escherichia albertii KF1]
MPGKMPGNDEVKQLVIQYLMGSTSTNGSVVQLQMVFLCQQYISLFQNLVRYFYYLRNKVQTEHF